MIDYAIYLESGPRRRKTMVHVLDLLGCIAQGPTTEDALLATPDAIRAYRNFLRNCDEVIEQDEFQVYIVEHVMEGNWLGNGDPTPGFRPDFSPLTEPDLQIYLHRLDGLFDKLAEQISGFSSQQMTAEPLGGGRSIRRIVEHIAESQGVYVRYTTGKVDGLSDALRALEKENADLAERLTNVWRVSRASLENLSKEQRSQLVPHGQVTWTARRGFRRMLEHAWEHLQEILQRKGFH